MSNAVAERGTRSDRDRMDVWRWLGASQTKPRVNRMDVLHSGAKFIRVHGSKSPGRCVCFAKCLAGVDRLAKLPVKPPLVCSALGATLGRRLQRSLAELLVSGCMECFISN